MKKAVTLVIVLSVMCVGVSCAFADTLARDALVSYTGTEAFTNLMPEERQACVSWLVHGGVMDEQCKGAVMKLVTEAPDAVSAEQRQALIAEASGVGSPGSEPAVKTAKAKKAPEPVKTEQTTIKKDDDTAGKMVLAGVIGLIAGLVIHNNVGHKSSSHSAPPAYRPEPPRPVHGQPPVHNGRPGQPPVRKPVNGNNPPRPPRR